MNLLIPQGVRLRFALLKRDYATQYAGTGLGISWVIIQSAFQILLFYFLFGFVLADRASGGIHTDFLTYLLSGMTLWLPVSEMMIRAGSILTENRALIRRAPGAISLFSDIPLTAAFVQYTLLFWLSVVLLLLMPNQSHIHVTAPLAYLYGIIILFFLSGWSILIARAAVLLKDLTPIVRLIMQVALFSAPIVYHNPASFFALNPLTGIIDIHRLLLTSHAYHLNQNTLLTLLIFATLSLIFFAAGKVRFEESVLDHI